MSAGDGQRPGMFACLVSPCYSAHPISSCRHMHRRLSRKRKPDEPLRKWLTSAFCTPCFPEVWGMWRTLNPFYVGYINPSLLLVVRSCPYLRECQLVAVNRLASGSSVCSPGPGFPGLWDIKPIPVALFPILRKCLFDPVNAVQPYCDPHRY